MSDDTNAAGHSAQKKVPLGILSLIFWNIAKSYIEAAEALIHRSSQVAQLCDFITTATCERSERRRTACRSLQSRSHARPTQHRLL
jgi:hypothetical protein